MSTMENQIERRPAGFKDAVASFRATYSDMQWAMLTACERAYHLGKIICAYAESEEVKACVEAYNWDHKTKGVGGTPRKAHAWVGEIFAEECGLKKETLWRWSRAYLKDQESGFVLGPKLAKALSDGRAKFNGSATMELPEPNVETMADEVADASGVSLRKPGKAPKAKDPDDELAGMMEDALQAFTEKAQLCVAFASKHKKNLKKFSRNERIERALDQVNAQAELIGFAWVQTK